MISLYWACLYARIALLKSPAYTALAGLCSVASPECGIANGGVGFRKAHGRIGGGWVYACVCSGSDFAGSILPTKRPVAI